MPRGRRPGGSKGRGRYFHAGTEPSSGITVTASASQSNSSAKKKLKKKLRQLQKEEARAKRRKEEGSTSDDSGEDDMFFQNLRKQGSFTGGEESFGDTSFFSTLSSSVLRELSEAQHDLELMEFSGIPNDAAVTSEDEETPLVSQPKEFVRAQDPSDDEVLEDHEEPHDSEEASDHHEVNGAMSDGEDGDEGASVFFIDKRGNRADAERPEEEEEEVPAEDQGLGFTFDANACIVEDTPLFMLESNRSSQKEVKGRKLNKRGRRAVRERRELVADEFLDVDWSSMTRRERRAALQNMADSFAGNAKKKGNESKEASGQVTRGASRRKEKKTPDKPTVHINPPPIPQGNLGRSLMEKMGWVEGQGLGAREQGMAVPIALKVKRNRRGIGDSS